jgi:outer membrane immunogenic protein
MPGVVTAATGPTVAVVGFQRFTGFEYRYSQFESKSFVYPIPVLNLGTIGLKQDLSNNQVTARIGYKF